MATGNAGMPSIQHHAPDAARALLGLLCDTYADAYGVTPEDEKTAAFRDRASKGMDRPGFELVTAKVGGEPIGFAFGYRLPTDNKTWWEGLEPNQPPEFFEEWEGRTFVLAEIEVRRNAQGKGVGRLIHDELLARRHEERATLATNPDANAVHSLYQSWGWVRIGEVPGVSGDYFDAYSLFVLPLNR